MNRRTMLLSLGSAGLLLPAGLWSLSERNGAGAQNRIRIVVHKDPG